MVDQKLKDMAHAKIEAIRRGGKEAFNLVRERPQLPMSTFDEEGDWAAQQCLANNELKSWCDKCWRPDIAPLPPEWPSDLGPIDDPLLDDELRQAGKQFTWGTGLASDTIHPRHCCYLSARALRWISVLFLWMEGTGIVPMPMSCITFCVRGKPGGTGRRLTALLHGLYRLWAKARLPVVQRWAAKHAREYMYAGPGRGSTEAAAAVLHEDEVGKLRGLSTAATLRDLDKCFEKVGHAQVVKAAVEQEFPLRILRVVLTVYSGSRRIVWNRAFSDAVAIAKTIVPGCTFATIILSMLLTRALDPVINALPRELAAAHWAIVPAFFRWIVVVYVDDISIVISGPAEWIVYAITRATALIDAAIRGTAGLDFGRDKTQAMATDRGTLRKLVRALAIEVPTLLLQIRFLGVDWGCSSSGAASAVRSGRIAAVTRRRGKFLLVQRRHGRKLAARLWAGAANPAGLHSVEVSGIPPRVLRQQRRNAARVATSGAAGKSTTAVLDVSESTNLEPAIRAYAGPVARWASKIFDAHRDGQAEWLQDVGQILKREMARMARQLLGGQISAMWAATRGPTSIFLTAVRHIGWQTHSHRYLTTHRGLRLDLASTAPQVVRDLAVEATRDRLWRDTAASYGPWASLHSGVEKSALLQLLRKRYDTLWTAVDAGRLAAIASHGMWTQLRLHAAGLAADSCCKLCGCENAGLIHRYYCCDAIGEQRRAFWADAEPDLARARVAHEGHPLWCHALLPRSMLPSSMQQHYEQQHLTTRWARGQHGTFVHGCVYLDGSLRNSGVPGAVRGGWAVAQLDTAGNTHGGGGIAIIRHGHGGALQAMRDQGFAIPHPPVLSTEAAQVRSRLLRRMREQCVFDERDLDVSEHELSEAQDFIDELEDPTARLVLKVAFHGDCAWPLMDITACEIYALYRALLVCVPGIVILTDSLNLVRDLQQGQQHCAAACNRWAPQWQLVWTKLADLGSNGFDDIVTVRHVPAHKTRAQMLEGHISRHAWVGNRWADHLAKMASSWHPPDAEDLAEWRRLHKLQAMTARWLVRAESLIDGSDKDRRDPARLKRQRQRAAAAAVSDNAVPHDLVGTGTRKWCRICGQHAKTDRGLQRLRAEVCRGPGHSRRHARKLDRRSEACVTRKRLLYKQPPPLHWPPAHVYDERRRDDSAQQGAPGIADSITRFGRLHGHAIVANERWAFCTACGKQTATAHGPRFSVFGGVCRNKPANATAARRLSQLHRGVDPYEIGARHRVPVPSCLLRRGHYTTDAATALGTSSTAQEGSPSPPLGATTTVSRGACGAAGSSELAV